MLCNSSKTKEHGVREVGFENPSSPVLKRASISSSLRASAFLAIVPFPLFYKLDLLRPKHLSCPSKFNIFSVATYLKFIVMAFQNAVKTTDHST
jgi:hypothetical protein